MTPEDLAKGLEFQDEELRMLEGAKRETEALLKKFKDAVWMETLTLEAINARIAKYHEKA